MYDHVSSRNSCGSGLSEPKCGLILTGIKETLKRLECPLKWVPSALQLADAFTKLHECDLLRALMAGRLYQITSEEDAMKMRADAKKERLERGARRAEAAKKEKGSSQESALEFASRVEKTMRGST